MSFLLPFSAFLKAMAAWILLSISKPALPMFLTILGRFELLSFSSHLHFIRAIRFKALCF
jgi:hypothetical protein